MRRNWLLLLMISYSFFETGCSTNQPDAGKCMFAHKQEILPCERSGNSKKEAAAGVVGLPQRVGGFEKKLVGLGGHQTPAQMVSYSDLFRVAVLQHIEQVIC